MKNRKLVIVSFLIIAALTLSIGYAALTTTLNVNGTVGVSADAIEFTEDVIFTAASSNQENFGTAAIVDEQTASFEVTGMTQQGERVQFTYTITNNSEYNVDIAITTTPTTTATNSKFTVTTALGDTTIAAHGGTVHATVTVVLNETVTVPVDNIGYVITYTATSNGDAIPAPTT